MHTSWAPTDIEEASSSTALAAPWRRLGPEAWPLTPQAGPLQPAGLIQRDGPAAAGPLSLRVWQAGAGDGWEWEVLLSGQDRWLAGAAAACRQQAMAAAERAARRLAARI